MMVVVVVEVGQVMVGAEGAAVVRRHVVVAGERLRGVVVVLERAVDLVVGVALVGAGGRLLAAGGGQLLARLAKAVLLARAELERRVGRPLRLLAVAIGGAQKRLGRARLAGAQQLVAHVVHEGRCICVAQVAR